MPATKQKTVEEILKNDPWFTPDTRLDLSSYPHLVPQADESDDGQFSMRDESSSSRGADLKAFLANLDREAVVEMRDPELLRQFDEQHGSGTTVHANGIPFQVYQRGGKWRATGTTPDGTLHRFTAESRDGLFPKIMRATKPQNSFNELTEEQKLQVVRLAQSGDRLTAIGTYLRFAIGDARAAQYDGPIEMLSDPALTPAMDAACDFCWFHSNPHATDDPAWHEYKKRILAGRPATFALLDAIWLRYQDHMENSAEPDQQTEEPAEAEPNPREIVAGLNDLDDSEVEQLMASTKRQYAREVLAGQR
jgi:hypothetical protein